VSILQSTSGVMGSLIYRKFKLPLNYSRLTEPKALAEFWSIAHGAADSIGAALSKPGWALRTRNREVCFYDTVKVVTWWSIPASRHSNCLSLLSPFVVTEIATCTTGLLIHLLTDS
jgi:hypothetical protein